MGPCDSVLVCEEWTPRIGRPKADDPRTKQLNLSFTPGELAILKGYAGSERLGTWARQVLLDHVMTERRGGSQDAQT